MIEWLVRKSLQYRFLFVVVIALLTFVSARNFFKNYGVSDNSLPVWFDAHDHDYVAYQNFLKVFGNDRFVVLGFQAPEVFSSDVLQFIKELTSALAQIPDVEKVTSITNAEIIEGKGDEIHIHPLVESVPNDPQELSRLKAQALAEPDFVGNIITPDSTITAITAKINTKDTVADSKILKQRLMDVVTRLNVHHYPFYLGGSPITDEALDKLVSKDQGIFLPGIFIVVILMILLFFRSFFVALVPTVIQMVVLLWILGIYYGLGHKMNVVGGMLVPIMVAVCIADSVHMMLDYYRATLAGLHRHEALVHSAVDLWRPCFYTSLTTVEGFISFQSSSIVPINVLGTLTALGVALAFLLTIFFIPVILSYIPEPKKKVTEHVNSVLIQKFLVKVTGINQRHGRKIMAIFCALTLFSAYGISRLKIETNFLEYFPRHDKVRQDLEFFDKNLSGIGDYELVLSTDNPRWEIAKDPTVLKSVDQFKEEVFHHPWTRELYTHVSIIKKLNQVFHEGKPEEYRIPDTQQEIAQLLLLAASSGDTEIDQYKTPDDLKIHMTLRSNWRSSEEMKKYMALIEKQASTLFNPLGVHVLLTGFGPLWIQLDHNLLFSQISSFLIAFTIVSLMMMIFLKSWKVGLISMVPNVLPIIFVMGIMGFLRIKLNVSTVMIAGVTIGITVDDTIHYLSRFKEFLKKYHDYDRAIFETNQTIGTAIIFTTCILIAGFLVLCFGSFVPSIYFGALIALTLFLSVFCEIFLTPVLIKWMRPF